MIDETLADGHRWYRICESGADDPLDDTRAAAGGGRWNPPGSWPTVHLNDDVVTARLNLDRFIAGWPYEPEDLDDAHGPHLAVATLPRGQTVADAHTPAGLAALRLPATYPVGATGAMVGHERCQRIGGRAHDAGLRGVHCRSVLAPRGASTELAWFPAAASSRARLLDRLAFTEWFWG
ncbi:MAG TPA: RES family NAD+ phosphorylase [Acidimicrobiales bacterium]|nr:RES family NAD+ phosphorylase [Acidimicrobiales bacterium]